MALLDLLPIFFFYVFQGVSNNFKLFLVVLGMELRALYILGKCWTNETTSPSSVSTHVWRLWAIRAEQKIYSTPEGVLKRWAGRKPYTTLEFAGLLEHL